MTADVELELFVNQLVGGKKINPQLVSCFINQFKSPNAKTFINYLTVKIQAVYCIVHTVHVRKPYYMLVYCLVFCFYQTVHV